MLTNEDLQLVKSLKDVVSKMIGVQNMYRQGAWYHADRKLQGSIDGLSRIVYDIEQGNPATVPPTEDSAQK